MPPAAMTCPSVFSPTRRGLHLAVLAGLTSVLTLTGGCKSFLDRSELVDPMGPELQPDGSVPQPVVQRILENLNLGVADEPLPFNNARDVSADDLVPQVTDYRIGANDLVRVIINDLQGRGSQTPVVPRVTESGFVSLPEVGQVNLAGLTEVEAERVIADRYRDEGILNNPSISVTVVEARNRTFSALGALAGGQYALLESDFRLLDALVLTNYNTAQQIDYAYVIRETGQGQGAQQPQQGGQPTQPPAGGADPLRPLPPGQNDPLAPRGDAGDITPVASDALASADREEAVYLQGQRAISPAGREFRFNAPEAPENKEIIRVPLAELLDGDLRYNIVIQPDDLILIPLPLVGEYYMGGHVAATGAFQILPGRELTLKQAVITARMLDAVAVPSRTQLIRRVGGQDVFVRVNLEKIFVGQDPDVMIRPNDIVMVGTDIWAPFLAAIRNGFRASYGFGFVYDRNFYDDDDFNNN